MRVLERLAERGIRLRNDRDGEHRTTCPRCSAGRTKKTDPCLSVKIEGENARWNCWHCGHAGGLGQDDRGGGGVRRGTRHQLQDFGAAARRLRYGPVVR